MSTTKQWNKTHDNHPVVEYLLLRNPETLWHGSTADACVSVVKQDDTIVSYNTIISYNTIVSGKSPECGCDKIDPVPNLTRFFTD